MPGEDLNAPPSARHVSRYTIGEYVRTAEEVLSDRSDSARLDAELIMGLALKKPRTYVIAWPERHPTQGEARKFEALVRRRLAGEPVAYMTGIKEFWSMPFRVNNSTLVPRPETELLVERALAHIPDDEELTVLDLGTGSGAVAVAIGRERPKAKITALDISAKALEIAALNARVLKAPNVTFMQSDWFTAVRGTKFHILVANPPYVDELELDAETIELSYEPRDALIAKSRGLAAIRNIISKAHNFLLEDGWMLLEHGYQQGPAVHRLLEEQRYYDIECFQDHAGKDRVTECRFVE